MRHTPRLHIVKDHKRDGKSVHSYRRGEAKNPLNLRKEIPNYLSSKIDLKNARSLGKVGYNSYGKWTTLGNARKLELERENPFPENLPISDDTRVVWISPSAIMAARFLPYVGVEEWDDMEALKRYSHDVVKIDIPKNSYIIVDDGDDGYLITEEIKK
jgi:hypothetical protein